MAEPRTPRQRAPGQRAPGQRTPARTDRPTGPRMPADLDLADLADMTDGLWTQTELVGSLDATHASTNDRRLVLLEVRMGAVTMVGAQLEESRLIDVTIDGADLAGVRFEESSLTRVEIRNTRLSGAQFAQARLRDVRFVDCVLTDANFAMAHGEKVRFEGCRMQRSDFRGAQLEAVAWWDCDLTDAEFSQVKVARAQLHGSIVDGLRGATSLTPISIDRHQFAPFAEHLLHSMGVSVADRTDV